MSSGGMKTNVAEYDPSVYEAEMQNKRMELTDKVTKRAFQAGKEANVYSEVALNSLNEGLGLLSEYLDERTKGERINLSLSENANRRATSLRQDAVAGAGFITGAMNNYMKQAQEADAQFKRSNKQ
jgi:hypothetical protein